MENREQEFWVHALDISRCRKIASFQKTILPLFPFSPCLLTPLLGSGYLKHSPCVLKGSPQLLCGSSRETLCLCSQSLGTEGFPMASWGRQSQWPLYLYSDAPLISIEEWCPFVCKSSAVQVACHWRPLRMWFIDLQNSMWYFTHLLAPGLDNKSPDNLCCWIIQAKWEAGNCWNTGAGCWSEQRQDYRSMGGRELKGRSTRAERCSGINSLLYYSHMLIMCSAAGLQVVLWLVGCFFSKKTVKSVSYLYNA